MRQVQFGLVAFHRCGRCGVHWLDRANLLAAVSGDAASDPIDRGVPKAGQRPVDGPSCPKDGGPLVPNRWLRAEFWKCARCEGILISEGNWNQLMSAATQKAKKEEGESWRNRVLRFVLEGLIAPGE